MTASAPFKSDFMLLDVKQGRHKLAARIASGEKVAVWVRAVIEDVRGIGRDDGTSMEFAATVQDVKVRAL